MNEHAEFKRINNNGGTAILFLHGIVGTPRHFDFLLPLVPEEWSIRVLLLPGHGGSVRDFSGASMAKWTAYAEAELRALAGTHDKVFIVGHSMGTLLAVHTAMGQQDKVAGIFSLAMPLCPQLTPSAMLTSLRTSFLPPVTDGEREKAARRSSSVALSKNPFAYLGWIPRYLELFTLCRETRQNISSFDIPCWVLQSAHDELVSRRSEKHLRGNPNITLSVLPSSRHYLYSAEDTETIKAEFESFIRM